MPTSNPALNDKIFARETGASAEELRPGWASPNEADAATAAAPLPTPAPDTVSPWTPYQPPTTHVDTMRVGGVVSASAVLLVLLVGAGYFGWQATTATPERIEFPGWFWLALFGGLGVAFLTIFKPKLARFTAPGYALLEGLLVGSISKVYDAQFNGIVLQAVALSIGVFVLMLFLYATRIIRVTDKLRMGIVAATGAVLLVYVLDLVVRMFGGDIGFVHDGGLFGIVFSLAVIGIAAFNFLLDFDVIERGVAAGAPRYMEWYAAFGLLVTLVWLYLEMLRLLARLRR
jgi:uncharacterized YccA/Bax inhibitor family protein